MAKDQVNLGKRGEAGEALQGDREIELVQNRNHSRGPGERRVG